MTDYSKTSKEIGSQTQGARSSRKAYGFDDVFRPRLSYLNVFALDADRVARLDRKQEHLNLTNLDRLHNKKEELNRRQRQVLVPNAIIVAVLFLTATGIPSRINLLGIGVNDISQVKGILLFVSAVLGATESFLIYAYWAVSGYLKRAIDAVYPEKFRNLYNLIYDDHFDIVSSVTQISRKRRIGPIGHPMLRRIVSLWFGSFVAIYLVSVVVFVIIVHAMIILDILNDPSATTPMINRLIVIFVIISDVTSIFIFLILNIGLRHINVDALKRVDTAKTRGDAAHIQKIREEIQRANASGKAFDV